MNNITQGRQLNRDLSTKKLDRFVLSFFRLDENIQNVLAEHVKEVTRPAIDILESSVHHKGSPVYQAHKAEFPIITVSFYDDNQSLVMDSIWRQVYRQLNRSDEAFNDPSHERRWEDASFDLNIKCFNSFGKNVEEYNVKRAWITNVQPLDMDISSDQDSLVTITLRFDDLEYVFQR